jgi:DNA polymerase bacteriophage-type
MAEHVYMDFETYSEISVKDVGAWRYAMDPSTEVLCLAYSIDRGPVRMWRRGDQDPEDLLDAVRSGASVHAHNAAFEYAVWNYVQTHWPRLERSQMRCTAALAAFHSLPFALDRVASILGTEVQKDADGKRLLTKFSKPRKPTKNNPKTRILPEDDPADFEKLCSYCRTDVLTEMAVLDKLFFKKLPKYEQEVYELDLKINERGVRVDVETTAAIVGLATLYSDQLEAEIEESFGFKSSQRAVVMDWCAGQGFPLENYQAGYLSETLKRDDIPKNVRKVLEARDLLGKTSVTKYAKILQVVGPDCQVRGSIQYYGASRTGRFAGRLLQVHNLPRGTVKGVEALVDFIRFFTVEDLKTIFDKPMEAFSSLVRSMIVSRAGKVLYVADFSNIEGRVLAWMAGQMDVVKQFASGDDLYKHMAATIFGVLYEEVDDDQRFVGKQAVLGCGYGMGGDKFLITCIGYGRDIGIELAKKSVKIYRKKNDKIVKAWYAVEAAAKEAVRNPGVSFEAMKCEFVMRGGYLMIYLPSRRPLLYRNPRIRDDKLSYEGLDQTTGQWVKVSTYGGKLVENIVQAASRDIMVDAMLEAEDQGFEIDMTVHDELVAEHERTDLLEDFIRILRTVPEWAAGCPIDAQGWVGERYRK